MKQTYEAGMKVNYEAASKRVVVAFRGRITVLPGTYQTESEGVRAGEMFCHDQGWVPIDPDERKKFRQPLW